VSNGFCNIFGKIVDSSFNKGKKSQYYTEQHLGEHNDGLEKMQQNKKNICLD
jgi:hypothetical protein